MPAVSDFLAGHKRVGVDANVVIALVEKNLDFREQIKEIFALADDIGSEIWISAIGVTEILIKPTQTKNFALQHQYELALFSGRFSFAPISLEAARRAASFDLKVRDALHIASLLEAGVTGFVTADRAIKSIKGLEVLTLMPA